VIKVAFQTGNNPEGSERSAVFLVLAWERILHCCKATARRVSWVVFCNSTLKKGTNRHSQDKGFISLLLKGNFSSQ